MEQRLPTIATRAACFVHFHVGPAITSHPVEAQPKNALVAILFEQVNSVLLALLN
jgi:hypothetical protein